MATRSAFGVRISQLNVEMVLQALITRCPENLRTVRFRSSNMYHLYQDDEVHRLLNHFLRVAPQTQEVFQIEVSLVLSSAVNLFKRPMKQCIMDLSVLDDDDLLQVASAMDHKRWRGCRDLTLVFPSFLPTTAAVVAKLHLLKTLDQVCIRSRNFDTTDSILQHMKALVGTRPPPSLRTLTLYIACYPEFRDIFRVRVQQRGLPYEYRITLNTLRPLLTFSNLRSLKIRSPQLFVDDRLVDAIASAMHGLEVLALEDRACAHATCAALRALNSKCPQLRRLALAVRPSFGISHLRAATVNANLVYWNVSVSVPLNENRFSRDDLARTLRRMWPSLNEMVVKADDHRPLPIHPRIDIWRQERATCVEFWLDIWRRIQENQ